jgi:hypothetical protein
LPTGPGTSGQVLQTDGTGITSWASGSGGGGGAAGSSTQIQYNNGTGFAASANLTFDGSDVFSVGVKNAAGSIQIQNNGGITVHGNTSGAVGLKAAASGATTTLTFPNIIGSANQVMQTNGSGVLSWVNGSSSGVVTVTVTGGLTQQPTANCYWSVSGKIATLRIGTLVGTSNGNIFTITGLPNNIIPARLQDVVGRVQIDSTPTIQFGVCEISTSGNLTVFKDANGSLFTNGNTVGLYVGLTFTYALN